jgi:hypothetical protein
MPDNTFRTYGEKLALALDQHIDREFRDRSEALQVRLAVADYFKVATVSAMRRAGRSRSSPRPMSGRALPATGTRAPPLLPEYRCQGACFKPPGVLHTRLPQAM